MTDEPEVKALEDCHPFEVWPQDTSPRELYRACLFHGTHKCLMVEIPPVWEGFKRISASTLQPVSWHCSPECGSLWLAYLRGTGPECHCLDTPGEDTT